MFYRVNKTWVRVRERVPILYYRDKTRIHMFYIDSNTTLRLQCDALVVWGKAYVDMKSFG